MASLKERSKKAKTVFALDAPTASFFSPPWPELSPQTSSDVLTALTALLSDLQELDGDANILIGPNPVTAYLEHIVQDTIPPPLTRSQSKAPKTNEDAVAKKPLAVFVTRSDQPSVLHTHLPFLCAASSVPLVALPKGSEQKLVKILKPESGRVYMLGIFEDTPGIDGLRRIMTDGNSMVGKVEMPDIFKSREVGWLDTRNKAVQTFVGEKRKQKGKSDDPEDKKAQDKTPKKKQKKEG